MSTWEGVLTSWGAVYTALFLPALLLLANFVFGRCFVSEAMCNAQHAPQAVHTASRVIGRAHVVLIALSFVWQYHVVMFVARAAVGGNPDVRACNPAYFVWSVVDALPSLPRAPVAELLRCDLADGIYLTLVTLFAVSYAACVFSVPQANPSVALGADKQVGVQWDASYCRRCGTHVRGMDHHCYFIGNCVGAANRRLFLVCLAAGVANLSYLLRTYGLWVLLHGGIATNAGAVLVAAFDAFLLVLLVYQALLQRRGWTTREFVRRRREEKESLWHSAVRLCWA